MISRRQFVQGIGTVAMGASAWDVAAQSWPTKPIRLLIGFSPGGGTDIVARALAPKMAEVLGQQIVLENKPGASGTIAADLVAKAAPDGYTLLMGHSNSNAVAPFVMKVPYQAASDFTPITYIGYVPNALVVHPSVQANSVPALIKLIKSKPGEMTYASSGIGSSQHLAGALFSRIAGLQMNHVPYKGSGQAIVDLLAGQVHMNFDTMPPVLEHIRSKKIRALAISTPKRISQLAEVPTFEEVGITGFDVTNWYSVMGPKGMPNDMVVKLDRAVKTAMNDPKIRATLDAQGLQSGGAATPEEFKQFLSAELDKYARIVKDLNIRSD